MLTSLVEAVVASWVVAAAVATGLALTRVRRADTRLFAWTCVLLVSAALPLLGGVIGWPDEAGAVVAVAAEGGRVLGAPARFAATSLPSETASVPWMVFAYCGVAAVLLAREVAGAHLAARLSTSATPVDNASFHESTRVRMPLTVGLLSPRIVLPSTWREWPEETLVTVLAHEQGHVVRRDGLRVAAARMFRAVCWINPLAWWLPRHLTSLADRASDEFAIERGVEATDYAATLLQFAASATSTPRVAWTMPMAHGSRSRIEDRIDHILSWKGAPPMSAISKVTVAAALITFGTVLQARPVPHVEQAATQAVGPRQGLALSMTSKPDDPVRITKVDHSVEHGDYASVSLLNQTGRSVRAVVFALSMGRGSGPGIKMEPLRSVRFEVDLPPNTLRTIDTRLVPEEEAAKITKDAGGLATLDLSIAGVEYATTEVEGKQGSRGAGPGQAGRAGAGQDQDRKEPVLLTLSHPKYTAEAMRQKIEGVVELELDIDADGAVTGARVVKSLDTMYGLDDQAIAAAFKITFRPATENGLAVGATVKFQMEFRLH